jgi:hypothetical protein
MERRCNKVSRQQNQLWTEIVNHADGSSKGMNREIRIVVKVAKQRDGEALQPFRPAPERNFLAHDARKVRLDECGVGREADHPSSRRETYKFSPGSRKKRQSIWDP